MTTARRHPRRTASSIAPALALLMAAFLAGCGGGGGDTGTDDAAGAFTLGSSTTQASDAAGAGGGTTSTPAAPAAAASATAADCGLPDFQAQLLARVNSVRAAGRSCGSKGNFGPAAALAWNDKLTAASAGHSQDMAAQNYFSHTSADGRTFVTRIEATGYLWRRLAENIAAGQSTVQEVVDDWMASDGHCANVMEPALTELGVACVPGTSSSKYRSYWTMDLGTPR